jgi:outer membrane immunogenic protein
MRKRKNLISALAVGLMCVWATAALADGPRSRISDNWSGFYFGGYVGGAWGDSNVRTDAGTFVPGSSYFTSIANIDSINQNGTGQLSPDSVIGGVQIGANLQKGNWVFGLEADFGAFNLNGGRGATNVPYPSQPNPPPPTAATYTVRASMDTDWLFTARARLGYALQPNLFIYATGGLALTNLRVSNSFSDDAASAGVGGGSHTQTMTGWTLGGGAEVALSRAWSIKAEYLYVDFGSTTVRSSVACGPAANFDCNTIPITPNAFSTSADLAAHIARLGLNYKF